MNKSQIYKITNPRTRVLLIVGAVSLLFVVLLYTLFSTPDRSIENYCKEHSTQKKILDTLDGDTWPSGIFNVEVGDAGDIAKSISKIEKVAPKDKSGDLTTLKQLYEKVDRDPSSAIDASLAGGELDRELRDWTREICNAN